jgi:Outer membrane protein beta-barrel domain
MKSTNYKKMILFFAPMLVVFIGSAAVAQVGLFIEPTVTYEVSDSDINYPTPVSDSTGHIEGFGLGARVGFHLSDVVFFGLDGRYSMPNFKDSSTNYDAKSVATNVAPVVGIQMPVVGLRIWGAGIIDGELNPEQSGAYDVKFSQAQGYRVGVGFHVMLFSLNLEYQDINYRSTTLEQFGPFSPGTNLDDTRLTNKSWVVGLSFPLAL